MISWPRVHSEASYQRLERGLGIKGAPASRRPFHQRQRPQPAGWADPPAARVHNAAVSTAIVTSPGLVEQQGVDVIAESDRRGRPRDLFWPWCAGNILLLQVAWGAYLFDFGLSFGQAMAVTLFGVVASFALVGIVSLVGMRGSAPTLVLSRAAFGVRGNLLPGLVGYLLMLGWETVNVSVAVLASGTIAGRLGIPPGPTRVVVFVAVVAVVMGLGILGFDAVMRAQKWFSWITLAMSVAYMALTVRHVRWSALGEHPAGDALAVLGACVMVFCAFGAGWTTAGGDYSRYLPRSSSRPGIVGWTTLGGSLPVVMLIGYGLLLCGTDPALAAAVVEDPIGGLAILVPTWFLLPFWFFALCGLVSGATLDLYSSGLALVAMGLPIRRWQAAALDGVLMSIASIWVVWFATDFLGVFEGFLITLGVPEAAWAGIFLADLVMVRWARGYDERKLFDATSAGYGSVRWPAVVLMLLCCWLGFGLVTNSAAGSLAWQGYLLEPLGLGGRDGRWAGTSIGVLLALVLGFVAMLPFARREALRGR